MKLRTKPPMDPGPDPPPGAQGRARMNCRRVWHPLLSRPRRRLLGACVVGGMVLYGWSYTLPGPPVLPRGLMACIALSAGLAWPVLVVALGLFGQGVPLLRWADACLRTMGIGMCFLMAGAAMKLLGLPAPAQVHLALLLVSGLVMTWQFLRECCIFGLSRSRALLLWGLGLQAPFLALLSLLRALW